MATGTDKGTQTTFRQAATREADPAKALAELDAALRFQDADAVVLFVSSEYDLPSLQAAINARVKAPLLCCTTAGEISSQLGYTNGGIVGASFRDCQAKLIPLTQLSGDQMAYDTALARANEEFAERDAIGLVVLDGLCRREESIIERLQLALPTIPIVGGSAGDACKFQRTFVYLDGEFQSDSGALLLLSGGFTASVFQTHHFTSSGIRVVATEVDAPNRRLIKLDGLPAATRLAQVLSCGVEDVTAEHFATKPMMVRCGDMFFVRGIQTVHPDGSISFFSALREGEILHVAKGGEIVDAMSSHLEALGHTDSAPDLLIGFDCITRRIELTLRGKTAEMNGALRQVPFMGFSTFGEQYHGQHVNQTMTGVAFWNH